MTDISISEARGRQMLDIATQLGAVSVTRADVAQHARLSGYHDLAAEIDRTAFTMAGQAHDVVTYLTAVLANKPAPKSGG